MEYVSIRDTKEVENTNNKNLSAVIAENRQDKEVNDLKTYSNTAVEAQTTIVQYRAVQYRHVQYVLVQYD